MNVERTDGRAQSRTTRSYKNLSRELSACVTSVYRRKEYSHGCTSQISIQAVMEQSVITFDWTENLDRCGLWDAHDVDVRQMTINIIAYPFIERFLSAA